MKKMHGKLILGAALAFSAGVFLSACDMYTQGTVNSSRLQVREEMFSDEIPTAQITKSYAVSLAQQYKRAGGGPVGLRVTYDPLSKTSTAMKAGEQAARIAGLLRAEGIRDVAAGIIPVREQGAESLALISFSSYSAEAPPDCATMPGYADTNIDHNPDYRLGCTVETLFARQVAHPQDLTGDNTISPGTDGRRAANIVDVYRRGEPNKPLKGESSTGD